MTVASGEYKDDFKSCTITTGVSSLNYYNQYIQRFDKKNTLLYNFMGVSSIKNISKIDKYNVIIDFCDNNIKEIVFELFNYLLAYNVEIQVKVVSNTILTGNSIEQCMTLLNRLDKHKLINLEIVNKSPEAPERKEGKLWINKLKKVFFFTGSGNTGKTSIISALSEVCSINDHRVALIDLTVNRKLINYFVNIYPLAGSSLERNAEPIVKDNKGTVDVYTYDYKKLLDDKEESLFCEYIKKINFNYDYVFVNTDINTVYGKSEIFSIAEKVFIIHDFMPTKINTTKQILLKLEEIGISRKGNISLIYNKMIRCYFNIGFIEEEMIFKRSRDKRLIPLVDLNCKTFEIPYSKKTMGALINNISDNRSIINNASYSYRSNIKNIYKYINNVHYVEIGEIDFVEYIKEFFSTIINHRYLKELNEGAYKVIAHWTNFKKDILYLLHSKILESTKKPF